MDMSKKDDINLNYNCDEDSPSIINTNKQSNTNIQVLHTNNKNLSINSEQIILLDNDEKSSNENILQVTNKNVISPAINLEKLSKLNLPFS